MKILGLCGYAGAGKDYVYRHLHKTRRNVFRIAFADEVREEVQDIVAGGRYTAALWDKPYPYEVRRLLQWWGTELRRSQDPDYWVEKVGWDIEHFDALHAHDTYEPLIVVTDVRYANEAMMVKDFGGFVAQVTAAKGVRLGRLAGIRAGGHPSEVIDFPVDGYIENSVTPTFDPAVEAYLASIETR